MHDLLQFALERPECCYRTCLSVRLKGKKLDEYSELGQVEGLEDGTSLELVEGWERGREGGRDAGGVWLYPETSVCGKF